VSLWPPRNVSMKAKTCGAAWGWLAQQRRTPGVGPGLWCSRTITGDRLARTIRPYSVGQLRPRSRSGPFGISLISTGPWFAADSRPSVHGCPIGAIVIICRECISRQTRGSSADDEGRDKSNLRFVRHSSLSSCFFDEFPTRRPAPLSEVRDQIVQCTSY